MGTRYSVMFPMLSEAEKTHILLLTALDTYMSCLIFSVYSQIKNGQDFLDIQEEKMRLLLTHSVNRCYSIVVQ